MSVIAIILVLSVLLPSMTGLFMMFILRNTDRYRICAVLYHKWYREYDYKEYSRVLNENRYFIVDTFEEAENVIDRHLNTEVEELYVLIKEKGLLKCVYEGATYKITFVIVSACGGTFLLKDMVEYRKRGNGNCRER